MKTYLSLIASVCLLVGCSSISNNLNAEQNIPTKGKVPLSCELPEVITAFEDQVPGSKFVPTQWQPLPDTDLAAVIDNKGIACTYGIQVAEVGGTVLWVADAQNIWEQRKTSWIEFGETPIDLPGIDESFAYILKQGSESGEIRVWRINLLINDVWVQVGATFLQNIEEALPIIKAAIAATK